MDNRQERTLAWGIIGTGKIAGTFAEGLKLSQTGGLAGIASRSASSAERFGDQYGVPRRYASYQAMLDDQTIEAVYISLPNHMHAEWTIKCAQAGKAILCEKPFTTNYAEAEQAIAAVKKHGVFMMEAFMYRCHPQMARLAQIIRDGAVGEVRLIQSHFGYNMGGLQKNIRQQNDAAGGGIMDIGCYAASLARLVAGAAQGKDFADPLSLRAFAHIGSVTRVDEWSTAVAAFPGDILANMTIGIQVRVDHTLRVWGSAGHIFVPNPWFPSFHRGGAEPNARILVYRDNAEQPEEIVVPGENPYTMEADIVARYREQKQAPAPCMTWDDSLGNMRTLDMWRKEVGLVFDVEK